MEKEHNKLWDYRIQGQIGKGESGVVYKVVNRKTSAIQALKKIPIAGLSDSEKRQIYREAQVLQKLDHPHVIKYHESFISADNLYIVMDYAAKGDLLSEFILRRKELRNFKESRLWEIFRQMASGLEYLHSQHIIHRDIKLQNIFRDKEGRVLLGDLGLSKKVHEKNQLTNKRVGTPIYFAPEMIQHQPHSFLVDVWALGCVFYSLANLIHPFEHAILENLADLVINKPLKPIKSFYSQKLCKVIERMLERKPSERVSSSSLVSLMREDPAKPQRINVFNMKAYNSFKVDSRINKKTLSDKHRQQLLNIEGRLSKLNHTDIHNEEEEFEHTNKGPIDLKQLLQTVRAMRPKSIGALEESFSPHKCTPEPTSYKTGHMSRTFHKQKSLTRNSAFDYAVRPMTSTFRSRHNQVVFPT